MENSEQLHKIRHSLAHVMASAVQKLKPEASFGVGPAIDNGFYYDFMVNENFTEAEMKDIEKEMRSIINQKLPFEREVWPIDKAIEYFESKNQAFKVELLKDLKDKGSTAIADAGDEDLAQIEGGGVSEVSIYKTGDFVDLCRGPHVDNTSEIAPDSFKLKRTSGVYWRGKEDNPQMQRVYGLAFETKDKLSQYLEMLVEAEKRDHRKLGQELDLFVFSDLVGSGLPMYTPRGAVIMNQLKEALNEIARDNDMETVSIPHLAKLDLYKISGHADKFEDELFRVQSHYKQEFILKPVNCPHHTQIYSSRPRSYKDLPIRYIEQTMQYRDEKPGQIGGLQRTRGFTVDDGHTFCTVDQIQKEADLIAEVIEKFYQNLGLWGDHWVSLSVRDPKTPEAYIGDPADWQMAEEMLQKVSDDRQLGAKRMEGEAALYGPKLDFMFKDALGRETQLATIQLDFAMPKRFELTYTDKDGSDKNPVMIHRAILGSFERFMMLLIEHFAGAFPLWLAPEQVRIIPVSDKFSEYAKSVHERLRKEGVRVKLDDDSESLGKRIRTAEKLKVPMIMVVGEKEQESSSVALRKHGEGDLGSKSLDEAVSMILEDISTRKV